MMVSPTAQTVHSISESFDKRWIELCGLYLPITRSGSIWRLSRETLPGDKKQGWKLHISATLLTANTTLERVGPFLNEIGVQFKGPVSLVELGRLNSGLHYGYTQVGKCLTVYPRSDGESVAIAEQLDKLTEGIASPQIPFDNRLNATSCVHYRYGAFHHVELDQDHGDTTLAIETPEGKLVPDVRDSAEFPVWATNPFANSWPRKILPSNNPLATRFRVFRALSQRGKGGVYLALDCDVTPPELCIVKEGRRDGEPGWDGRDGYWRIRSETRALPALDRFGLSVPKLYDSFELQGNAYLVTEYIEGTTLQVLLAKRRRRLPIRQVITYGIQIAAILEKMHSNGWIWRDCKPANLVLTKSGALRPIDFEGACRENESDPVNWATPAFASPEIRRANYRSSRSEDLFAFGITLYYLLAGEYPEGSHSLSKVRRNLPVSLSKLVLALISEDSTHRPDAATAGDELRSVLSALAS